jgi:hypothetical protein
LAWVKDTKRDRNYTFSISGCDSWLPGPQKPCSVPTTLTYRTQKVYPPECNLCDDFVGKPVKGE